MYLNKYCGMMAILAISEQHIKLLEKSSVFFLLVGQSSHSLHVLVHTHLTDTQLYSHFSLQFFQPGGEDMLPAYDSPPSALLSCISMWNAFEDDKLLFFDLPSARLFLSYSFQWSDQTRNHKHTCRDVQGTKPRLLLQALWLALQLATRLSGLTLPEPLSHYHPLSLHKKKKGQGWRSGKKSKPVEEIQSNIWMHYFVVLFSFRIGLVFVSFSSKCKSCNVATKSNTNLEEKCVFSFS